MSQKFNAKNLSYNATLPPFLAALRGQTGPDSSSGPNPLLSAQRRHGVKRSRSAEAEDAPLVVDDEGNVVSDARVGVDGSVEYDSVKDGAEEGDVKGEGKEEGKEEGKDGAGRVPAIGRKRRPKVIGAGQEDEDESESAAGKSKSKSKTVEGGSKDAEPKAPPKPKKKAKKIKLSFDEDG